MRAAASTTTSGRRDRHSPAARERARDGLRLQRRAGDGQQVGARLPRQGMPHDLRPPDDGGRAGLPRRAVAEDGRARLDGPHPPRGARRCGPRLRRPDRRPRGDGPRRAARPVLLDGDPGRRGPARGRQRGAEEGAPPEARGGAAALQEVAAEGVLGQPGQGWKLLERVADRGKVGLCAEMCGGAQKVLEMSVEYAKVREQFGRPIGSFQAIQHKCANMLVEVESSKSATYYAAWAVANDVPEASLAAAMAKAYCSDAYRHTAGEGIQIHGGIGFTWEHDMHIYFKRAKSSEVTFGDATWNREIVAQLIGL